MIQLSPPKLLPFTSTFHFVLRVLCVYLVSERTEEAVTHNLSTNPRLPLYTVRLLNLRVLCAVVVRNGKDKPILLKKCAVCSAWSVCGYDVITLLALIKASHFR